MLDRSEVGKRGYLQENFRLFHLKDRRAQKLDYHYHEFDKLVILLDGKASYVVEGVTYYLEPWDVLLVQHNMIHRPIIDSEKPYERMVLWLRRDWMERNSTGGISLDTCFEKTRERGIHLLRTKGEQRLQYMRQFQMLEESLRSKEFGAEKLADTLCQQILIHVSRDVLKDEQEDPAGNYHVDRKIEAVMQYITGHLNENLSVENLCSRFYISRYYLMHRFKEVTGYTLHRYVVQKRTLAAAELLRQGYSATKAAEECGFQDYSTFLRSFNQNLHMTPKEFVSRI